MYLLYCFEIRKKENEKKPMLIKTPRSTPRVLSLKSDCTLYILNDNYQEKKKAPLSTAQQVNPFYAMPPILKRST